MSRIVFDVYYGRRFRRQAVVQRGATLIKQRRREMAEATTGIVRPATEQPPATLMNAPGNQSTGALSAASKAMAPRGGEPTPRSPTQPGIPSAAEGVDAPLPSAPVMPTPSTAPSALRGSAPPAAPQRLEQAKSLDEIRKGAQGPQGENVGYQGTRWGDQR
jgi:hypothetical protein